MKKLGVRLLSMLMCIAVMVGVAPAVLAEEPTVIQNITITDVKAPVSGEFTSDASYDVATVAEDAPYTVEDVSWYNAYGNWFGGLFVEGKGYKVRVVLAPKEGYQFDRSASDLTVTINGQAAKLDMVWSDGTAGITCVFTATGNGEPVVIPPKTNLYYDGFKIADGASVPGSFPEYSESDRYNYKSKVVSFLEDGEEMTASTFTKGKEYTMDVVFTADENCVFDTAATYKAQWLDMDIFGEQIACDGQTVTFRFTVRAPETLTEASIKFELPVGGKELPFKVTLPEDAKYEVTGLCWEFEDLYGQDKYYGPEDAPLPKAVLGQPYYFFFYIEPMEGYAFPESEKDFTVTVNDVTVKRTAHGGERRWGYTVKEVYAQADTESLHNVTAINGTVLDLNGDAVTSVPSGAILGLDATPAAEGMVFQKWVADEGTPEILNAYAAETGMVVYDDTAVRALYAENREYNITAEGCTLSAEKAAPGETVTVTVPTTKEGTFLAQYAFQNQGLRYTGNYQADSTILTFTMPAEDVTLDVLYLPFIEEMTFRLEKNPEAGDAVAYPTLASVNGQTEHLEEYLESSTWIAWEFSNEDGGYNGGVYPGEGVSFLPKEYYCLVIYAWNNTEDCVYKLLVGEEEFLLEAEEDYGEMFMQKIFHIEDPKPVYDVTFQVNGETVSTQSVEEGALATAPEEPVLEGKVFLGWFTEEDVEFDFATPITGPITLIAKFEDEPLPITYGDADGNGSVDAADALKALQQAVKLITLEEDAFAAANVNGDDKVDATDALLMLQYTVKLIDKFPVEG